MNSPQTQTIDNIARQHTFPIQSKRASVDPSGKPQVNLKSHIVKKTIRSNVGSFIKELNEKYLIMIIDKRNSLQ